MQQILQALDYRIALLTAVQREVWNLRQERTDADARRELTLAALEALKGHTSDTSVSSLGT